MASLPEFLQSLRERNQSRSLYSPVGAGILGADVTRTDASAGRNFGANLAKAILGGIALKLGKQEQDDYASQQLGALRAIYGGQDPSAEMFPALGGDINDLKVFQATSALESAAHRAAIKDEAGLKIEGEQEAYLKALKPSLVKKEGETVGSSTATDPNVAALAEVNPIAKGINKSNLDKQADFDALRKEFNGIQAVKDFPVVAKAASAISGALKDTGKVADQELVRYSIQMIEPGMAVREGEQNAVKNSQSIPDAWKGELAGALDGKSVLGDDARAGIQRLAQRAYEASKQNYSQANDYYSGLATKRGYKDPLSYIGTPPDSGSVFPVTTPSTDQIKSEYKALVAQTGNAETAKAQIKAKYGM